jgi:hypothetical protein
LVACRWEDSTGRLEPRKRGVCLVYGLRHTVT